MKNIKAIMCDVDGTLLTDDGVVSPFTIEMIKEKKGFCLDYQQEEMLIVYKHY